MGQILPTEEKTVKKSDVQEQPNSKERAADNVPLDEGNVTELRGTVHEKRRQFVRSVVHPLNSQQEQKISNSKSFRAIDEGKNESSTVRTKETQPSTFRKKEKMLRGQKEEQGQTFTMDIKTKVKSSVLADESKNNDVLPSNDNVSSNDDALPLNKEVSSNEDTIPINKEVSSSNDDALPINKEVSSSNDDALPLNKEVSSSNDDALPLNKEVPSSNDEALPLNKEVPSSNDDDALPLNKEVPSSNDDAIPINKEVSPLNKGHTSNDEVSTFRLTKEAIIPQTPRPDHTSKNQTKASSDKSDRQKRNDNRSSTDELNREQKNQTKWIRRQGNKSVNIQSLSNIKVLNQNRDANQKTVHNSFNSEAPIDILTRLKSQTEAGASVRLSQDLYQDKKLVNSSIKREEQKDQKQNVELNKQEREKQK